MVRLLVSLLLPLTLLGADWVRLRSGPFEVLSEAGDNPARILLNEFEQVRFVLDRTLGETDMEAVWPFRAVIFSSANDAARYRPGEWRLGRDTWMLALSRDQKAPLGDLVRILLEANTQRMPAEVERGLLDVFETAQVDGTRVTLGAPPPPDRRDLAWARMHMLAVNPKYASRARVLFANLQLGADWHAAYKNSFAMTPEEMDAEVQEYLSSGAYSAHTVSGAPISTRDFSRRDFGPVYIDVALADLLDGAAADAAYTEILASEPDNPEALEGLGRFEDAVKAGSRSARCLVEYGKLLAQPAAARNAFVEAARLNPRWDEPYVQMARVDTNLSLKMNSLQKAAERNSRNPARWAALAEAYTEANQFQLAAEAWGGAMRAAPTAEERERYYQARLALEEERAKYHSSDRIDRSRERRVERSRMREEWAEMMERARETGSVDDPDTPADVIEWWDDERPKKRVRGTLQQVDCTGGLARLHVSGEDGEAAQLLVRDPGQIVITGGGETALGCGVQEPARSVTVEYFVESDAKWKTAGEVTLIEFR